MLFKGSATALITPMNADGKSVNYETLKKLIDFQIENGTKALIILGTTGEPATLSEEEKTEIAKFVIGYVNKKIPVVLGAGSNCTSHAIEQSLLYEKLGADALLHVTPYYNKCTQNGLIEHFTKVADSVNIPIILYNVPGRTGVNILPETVLKLSEHKNIVAVKEASGNIEQIMEIRRICPENFEAYSGDDGLIFPVLAIGGAGVISVLSNVVPKETSEICEEFFGGNLIKSRELQFKLNPLIKLLFSEVNPIPVKAALNKLGFDAGALRLPLTEMEEKNKTKLFAEMKKLNLI